MLLNNTSQQDAVFFGLKTTNNFMHNQQKPLGIASVLFNLSHFFKKSILILFYRGFTEISV